MHAQIQIFIPWAWEPCLSLSQVCLYHRCLSNTSNSIWIIVDANICCEDDRKLRKDDLEMAFATQPAFTLISVHNEKGRLILGKLMVYKSKVVSLLYLLKDINWGAGNQNPGFGDKSRAVTWWMLELCESGVPGTCPSGLTERAFERLGRLGYRVIYFPISLSPYVISST